MTANMTETDDSDERGTRQKTALFVVCLAVIVYTAYRTGFSLHYAQGVLAGAAFVVINLLWCRDVL